MFHNAGLLSCDMTHLVLAPHVPAKTPNQTTISLHADKVGCVMDRAVASKRQGVQGQVSYHAAHFGSSGLKRVDKLP